MHPHLAGYASEDHMPIVKLHSKRRIRKTLNDLTLRMTSSACAVSSVCRLPGAIQLVLKFAFFSSESYC